MTDPFEGEPQASGRASLAQLRTLRRAQARWLVVAVGVLSAGVLLASLPIGRLVVLPATLLFVLGLLGTPLAAVLLWQAHRRVAESERQAADRRG